MSRFRTTIPIDLKELLQALPQDTYIHSIVLDREYHPEQQKQPPSCVVIEWESAKLKTGYHFAVDYPLEDLKRRRHPSCVRKLLSAVKAIVGGSGGKDAPKAILSAKNTIPDTQLRTSEAVKEAFTKGFGVEYQGVEAQWMPLLPGYEYVEGYYYRLQSMPPKVQSAEVPLEKVPVDAS